MRDAFYGIIAKYSSFIGNSKIHILFLLAVFALILIDENNEGYKRRLPNPAVFLLSLWSGISCVVVKLISGKKRIEAIAISLVSFVLIALSGKAIFSKEALALSNCYVDTVSIILSILAIVVYFLIYYLISRELFEGKSEKAVFMAGTLVLHIFGFYSEEAMNISLFLSPTFASSIIIHGIMPALLLVYLKYEDKIKAALLNEDDSENKDDITYDEIPEEWDMKKHKILNMRNMAIAFVVMIVVFVAAIFVLNSKINSLYDATVLLENAAKSKMTVYEMKDANGSVSLTLMVSPDGTVTAYGGGDKTNGTESYDFISKNVEKVDKWYLYGDDEANRGAYDFCVNEGIEVSETYVISGIKELDD